MSESSPSIDPCIVSSTSTRSPLRDALRRLLCVVVERRSYRHGSDELQDYPSPQLGPEAVVDRSKECPTMLSLPAPVKARLGRNTRLALSAQLPHETDTSVSHSLLPGSSLSQVSGVFSDTAAVRVRQICGRKLAQPIPALLIASLKRGPANRRHAANVLVAPACQSEIGGKRKGSAKPS